MRHVHPGASSGGRHDPGAHAGIARGREALPALPIASRTCPRGSSCARWTEPAPVRAATAPRRGTVPTLFGKRADRARMRRAALPLGGGAWRVGACE